MSIALVYFLFKVEFSGEGAFDAGGPQREFFTVFSKELNLL